MPLPSPRKGESKQAFISRFMRDESAKSEFKNVDQRVAVAGSKWDAQGRSGTNNKTGDRDA